MIIRHYLIVMFYVEYIKIFISEAHFYNVYLMLFTFNTIMNYES